MVDTSILVVSLSNEEQTEVDSLTNEFVATYPGKHHGEIESLVVAKTRKAGLVVSDNFAPWWLRKRHPEYRSVKIVRGYWAIGRLLEANAIEPAILEKLKGRYPSKIIQRFKRRWSV